MITDIWEGADHICWWDWLNYAAKGATCSTMAYKSGTDEDNDSAYDYPGFPMIQQA